MIKYKYTYKGPIFKFNDIVANDYKMETIAENENKAASQMIYRFKKDHNLVQNTRITIRKELIKQGSERYMY